ncbi:MAG: hypothetical protein CL678_05200 [Bdellovibrionaceae bacterium]|nr:hypothetical protein [Pseudobdellovibrionaceae bacterium]
MRFILFTLITLSTTSWAKDSLNPQETSELEAIKGVQLNQAARHATDLRIAQKNQNPVIRTVLRNAFKYNDPAFDLFILYSLDPKKLKKINQDIYEKIWTRFKKTDFKKWEHLFPLIEQIKSSRPSLDAHVQETILEKAKIYFKQNPHSEQGAHLLNSLSQFSSDSPLVQHQLSHCMNWSRSTIIRKQCKKMIISYFQKTKITAPHLKTILIQWIPSTTGRLREDLLTAIHHNWNQFSPTEQKKIQKKIKDLLSKSKLSIKAQTLADHILKNPKENSIQECLLLFNED